MARGSVLACCFLLLAIGANAMRLRPTLIVMGDSFSDNGNAYRVSNHTLPAASQGYSNGRFADGPVWNDYIADAANIDILNTGFPGATACAPQQPNAGFPFTVPYLAQQADTVATASRHLSSNRAVFIWMGANDLSGLSQGLLMGTLNYTQAMAMIPSIRQCIKTTAEGLLHYGITKSLTISTIQNIAIQPIWSIALRTYQVPTEAGNQLLGAIGSLARALNDGIYADAADLAQKYKRAKVSVFDMYGLYYSLRADGPMLGLTNVTDACLNFEPWYAAAGDPSNNITSTCSNPGSYEFWDSSHPTTATHRILAQRIQWHLTTQSDLFPMP